LLHLVTVPRTIVLGDTEVPRIGLGTNRLTDSEEHIRFVQAAVTAGLRHIDTAHVYTRGASERGIGAGLTAAPAGCVVATKGGRRPGEGRPEALAVQIEQSLGSLRSETIDLYYLHSVDPETPIEESMAALAEHRDAGRIRNVGLSNVGVAEIERARTIVPIAAVQNAYNLSERSSDDVVDWCAAEGVVFVPYFPLRGGKPALAEIARRRGVSPSRVALAWLLRRSPAMLPIPGTLSLSHLRDNLAALELELSDEEYAALS
jgi:pyridoxine 4-dehydrogenase